ncbi:hypothetical protein BGX23_012165 [Mortierella sp. AD031]|nr:hypothetical protein BGX23_012165 [Mortierella sp. AD031]KAG0215021.1 hypothetical protein BGX33_001581 [Mortierella sp. NVP41]
MSDSDFDMESQRTKLHAIYGHHHHRHTLSAVDLTAKLEQLQMEDNESASSIADQNEDEQGQGQEGQGEDGESKTEHHSHRHHRHDSHRHHHRRHSSQRHHHRQVTIDPELQKWGHEQLHEILERLEHQRRESEFFQHTFAEGVVPGMEDNGSGRLRHTHSLSPEILKDLSLLHTLKQSHGQANLRHSRQEET